jgi:hypothetical protein
MIFALRKMEQILLAWIKSRRMEHVAEAERRELNAKFWLKIWETGWEDNISQDIRKIV